ncbi:hypothetical protein BURPSS13_C0150 [Burkholderia pseudomallei S13]|nr:hypothetical protein BURPSS13_C0150 [Burkholderia pseudomallei S13]
MNAASARSDATTRFASAALSRPSCAARAVTYSRAIAAASAFFA